MARRPKSDPDEADEALLKEARNRWKLAESAGEKQRQRELDDLKFYAGEQWDSDVLNARKGKTLGSGANQQIVPARPSLTINKTLEPVRQVLNQERQADLGYELVPADDFGGVSGPIDHTEIELREGLVRRIQRDSEAEDARTWAFQRAAIAGQGYRVVMTRYLPGKRADQEIYIDRIYNQNSVMLDPSHEQPDASDINWGFYGTDMLWDAFKVEYPEAKAALVENDDEWRALGDEAPGWFRYEGQGKDKARVVRVVNYYYVEKEAKTLYHLSDGSAAYKEELDRLPPGVTVIEGETHQETKRTVKWCKLTGNEVLDRTDWPGRWIPIIREVGEELQPYDSERRAQGVVRPMRDSCKGNNYIISKFAEYIGLQPIPPFVMAGGQDEGFEAEWDAINTRTLGRVHFNQKDQFNQPAPPPQRMNVSTDVSGLAMGVQMFGQAIQATSVVPETALGNTDPTVKSGKLAAALIQQAEMGTSNFMDNHKRSLRHEARIVNDLLYPIYGSRKGRMVQMVNGQGEHEAVILGQPFRYEGQGPQKKPVPMTDLPPGQPLPPEAKLYSLTPDADFNIAIKISKKIDTRRQQIVQFLAEWLATDPSQVQIMGDLIWKYLDVPDHQQVSERYRVMLAPPIQKLLSGDSPLPPEAQQQIAMLEGQIQQLMPLADKNQSDLEKVKIQESAETERARLKQMGDDSRTRADNETKIAVAALSAKVERLALFLEERARIGLSDQQASESEATRQFEREQAAAQAQHEAAMAQQGQQFALEQGQQTAMTAQEQAALEQQFALEQQAQQAALAPPTEPA